MNSDDGDHEAVEGPPLSTRTVVAEGAFGAVTWVLPQQLYDLLPRNKRDPLLDMAGDRRLSPFFTDTCNRMLRQAGRANDASSLSGEWSLEECTVTCAFGQVTWAIGEGLWRALPEDQRGTLLDLAKLWIHAYFHKISGNLASWALQNFSS